MGGGGGVNVGVAGESTGGWVIILGVQLPAHISITIPRRLSSLGMFHALLGPYRLARCRRNEWTADLSASVGEGWGLGGIAGCVGIWCN